MRVFSLVLGTFITLAAFYYLADFKSYQIQTSPQVLAVQTSTVNLTSEQTTFLTKINEIRQDNGVNELVFDESLGNVSEYRVKDMADKQYYSHKFLGTNYTSLFNNYGVDSTSSCENLQLQEGPDISEAISAWENSSAHFKCLINPKTFKIGFSSEHYSSVDAQSQELKMYVFAMIASN